MPNYAKTIIFTGFTVITTAALTISSTSFHASNHLWREGDHVLRGKGAGVAHHRGGEGGGAADHRGGGMKALAQEDGAHPWVIALEHSLLKHYY